MEISYFNRQRWQLPKFASARKFSTKCTICAQLGESEQKPEHPGRDRERPANIQRLFSRSNGKLEKFLDARVLRVGRLFETAGFERSAVEPRPRDCY